MGSDAVLEALKELHDLLVRYNRPQSVMTKRLLDLRVNSAVGFDRLSTSDEVWDTPGCIWQVSFYESGMHSGEEARHDDLRFHNAIVRLVEGMEVAGLHHPRAKIVCKTFCTWIRLNTRSAAS